MHFQEYETMLRKNAMWVAVGIVFVAIVALGSYVYLKESQSRPTAPSYLASPSHTDTGDTTVYVTRAGLWYHRGSCRDVQKSRIPVKLSQVQQYCRPCSKCRPPR